MAASANPILAEKGQRDPTLFCTGFKRQRFYLFTRAEPEYEILLLFFFIILSLPPETTSLTTVTSLTSDLLVKKHQLLQPLSATGGLVHPLMQIRPQYTLHLGTCTCVYFLPKRRKPWKILLVMRGLVTSTTLYSTASYLSS